MSQLSQLPRIPRKKYGKRQGLTKGEKEMNTKERNKEHAILTRQRRRIYRLCSEAYKTGIPISEHSRQEGRRHRHHHHMDDQEVDSDSGDDDDSFTSDLHHVSDPGIPIMSSSPRSVDEMSSVGMSSWSLSSLSHSKDVNVPPKKRPDIISQMPDENVPLIIASPLSSMMSPSSQTIHISSHTSTDTTSNNDESLMDCSMMVDHDTIFEYPNHHACSNSVTTLPECDSLTSDLSLR